MKNVVIAILSFSIWGAGPAFADEVITFRGGFGIKDCYTKDDATVCDQPWQFSPPEQMITLSGGSNKGLVGTYTNTVTMNGATFTGFIMITKTKDYKGELYSIGLLWFQSGIGNTQAHNLGSINVRDMNSLNEYNLSDDSIDINGHTLTPMFALGSSTP